MGWGVDGDLLLSEEERTHIDIIGTTRVGKSKFMEVLARGDIDLGSGLCFVDSSDNGQTTKDVLRYCAEVKHEKVLVIDPLQSLLFKRVLPINLMEGYPDEAAERILDIILIQFQQRDITETPVIKQYLPAIVRTLHRAGLTFAEARYFVNPVYEEEREEIFNRVGRNDDTLLLKYVFKNRDLYREYRPTARRILDVFNHTIEPMFSSTEGVDFRTLIKDKWVVLVNLYPKKGFGVAQARFLGTAIINEFIRAIDDLVGADWIENDAWKGKYYLYIDEAGRYANRNIANLLSYKGKTGLQLILAHHHFGQIEDLFVREAVLNQTDTKVVFRMNNPKDAELLAKMVYGGQVKDRDGSFYFKNLNKRECVVKFPGQEPRTVTVDEVKYKDNVDVRGYLEKVYAQEAYRNTEEIIKEQRQRLEAPYVSYQTEPTSEEVKQRLYEDRGENYKPSKSSSKANRRANSKGGLRQPENTHQSWERVSQQFEQRDWPVKTDGSQEDRPGQAKASAGEAPGAQKP